MFVDDNNTRVLFEKAISSMPQDKTRCQCFAFVKKTTVAKVLFDAINYLSFQ